MEGSLVFLILVVVILATVSKWLSSAAWKGLLGEQAVHRKLVKSLVAPDYRILRDVTLMTGRGTTQIDHIVVSRFGIFVIETKNMSGWIFGSENDAHWTQSFRRSKVRFQNPLRQNYAHTRALQELLGLDASKLHSVVVFTGKAEFKKRKPLNVMHLNRLAPYIESRATPLLGANEVQRAVATIESNRLAAGATTNAAHIESLRDTHQSVNGVIQDARGLMRHGITALIWVKTVAGVVLIVLLLMVGDYTLKRVSGLLSGGSATSTVKVITPGSTVSPAPQPLMCGYSTDTLRCACYDTKGGKVAMPFDECKALADKDIR